ncbi:hypothetical protein MSAN_02066200 [Mycena sanguinolenta]|uniref:Uncharacterized protein n=1 Tax=Mycena sanguinolenta TaxID=230812 RepID=A0A8H7CL26_9AGAR|nr:hypothetical protein MSAN_02066200 [Mycena sanguinolenta]
MSTLGKVEIEVATSGPRLPPELERVIFETAASEWPPMIPTTMLVAWRVKHWIEPLLYRLVHVSSALTQRRIFPVVPVDVLLKAIENQQSSLLEAVEYLFLQDIPASHSSMILGTIFSACPRITHLFSMVPLRSNLYTLSSIDCLRHLAFDALAPLSAEHFDFTHPLFRNVTHLQLLQRGYGGTSRYSSLSAIPNLTHIAFNSATLAVRLRTLLETLPRLQCIVVLSAIQTWDRARDLHRLEPQAASDERFVHIEQNDFHADWYNSAMGGSNFWDLAEEFLAVRRAGKVPRSMYSISDTDMRLPRSQTSNI